MLHAAPVKFALMLAEGENKSINVIGIGLRDIKPARPLIRSYRQVHFLSSPLSCWALYPRFHTAMISPLVPQTRIDLSVLYPCKIPEFNPPFVSLPLTTSCISWFEESFQAWRIEPASVWTSGGLKSTDAGDSFHGQNFNLYPPYKCL